MLAAWNSRSSPPGERDRRCEQAAGQPHPIQFREQNLDSAIGHEARYADGRDLDDLKRSEKSIVRPGPKECNAPSAVGEGVERPVRCPGSKQEPECGSYVGSKCPRRDRAEKRDTGGEKRRMRETAMSVDRAVRNIELETNDVHIRQYGGDHARRQQPRRNGARPQPHADSERNRGMRQNCGHGVRETLRPKPELIARSPSIQARERSCRVVPVCSQLAVEPAGERVRLVVAKLLAYV